MNRLGLIKTAYTALAALMLAACASDELADGTVQDLPEGKYPLQIAGVSVTAESTAEPWGADAPQTRVSENTTNGKSSAWENGDLITVQIGDDNTSTGTYSVDVDASGNVTGLTTKTALYWKNKTAQKVKGWYPADITNDISLKNQGVNGTGLAYALYAETANTVDYQTQTPIELPFKHQLAKVRVVLEGSGKDEVKEVKVLTYPTCKFTPNDANTKIKGSGNLEYIPMQETTYNNGTTCWEANVVPGYKIEKVKVNDVETTLTTSLTPQATKVNTIKLTVNKATLKPTDGKFTINAGDDVVIKDYDGTAPIVVNGNASITLDNVQLATEGTAMEVNNGATVTLNVVGKGNSLASTNGSGIGAHENSNIKIKGTSATESELKVTAGEGINVGIGFIISSGGGTYGNIDIDKITLNVEAQEGDNSFAGAAIGITSCKDTSDGHTTTCGDITITNSNVTAFSKGAAACIGTSNWRDCYDPCIMGIISIEGSTITATSAQDAYGACGACIGLGCIASDCAATIKKIIITSSTLNLTTGASYKVGKGTNFGTATITENILVDNDDKGKDGWNP